jgi:archaemetzincin
VYLWLALLALAGLGIAWGTAAPLTIRLISVGSLPPALLGFLQEGLTRELDAVVRMGGNLPLPASCPEGRSQYPGAPLLAALAAARPPGEEVVLGVTGVDLTAPGLNFVFGLADPPSRCAVISLARLYPEFYGQPRDPRLFKARALKEAVHELGHLWGLGHCPDPGCVMFFSNSLADTDRKGPGFCERCRELWREKH